MIRRTKVNWVDKTDCYWTLYFRRGSFLRINTSKLNWTNNRSKTRTYFWNTIPGKFFFWCALYLWQISSNVAAEQMRKCIFKLGKTLSRCRVMNRVWIWFWFVSFIENLFFPYKLSTLGTLGDQIILKPGPGFENIIHPDSQIKICIYIQPYYAMSQQILKNRNTSITRLHRTFTHAPMP